MAFYDCVRTLNINTLDELKPYISIYHVLAPSEAQCNHDHQGGFHDYTVDWCQSGNILVQ